MFGNRGAVAFVGSTLPYLKVKHLFKTGKIEYVVCSTLNLYDSYLTGLKYDNLNLKIYYLSDNRFLNLLQLLKWVVFTGKIYIFHECYWRNLDLILLAIKREVVYSPDIGLEGRELIYPVTIKSVGLKSIVFKRYFDYYRSLDNLILGDQVVLALKSRYRRSVEIIKPEEKKAIKDKKALLVLGMDGVENHYQERIFRAISSKLAESGYWVDVKDHPNKDFRLECSFPASNYLNPLLPADCLVRNGYKLVIGFSSAAMALNWNADILTIAKLLPQKDEKLVNLKLAHLDSLNFKYHLLESIQDLDHYL